MIGGIEQSAGDLVRAFDSRYGLANNFTPHRKLPPLVQIVQDVPVVQPPPSSPATRGRKEVGAVTCGTTGTFGTHFVFLFQTQLRPAAENFLRQLAAHGVDFRKL